MKLSALVAALALASCETPLRSAAAQTLATHNGSLMEVIASGYGGLEIRYLEPRPGLWPAGVRPGMTLVAGAWLGPLFQGYAHVFAGPGCVTPYAVRGGADPAGVLVLTGPAPIVDWGCYMRGLAWTGNSTLVFVPVR